MNFQPNLSIPPGPINRRTKLLLQPFARQPLRREPVLRTRLQFTVPLSNATSRTTEWTSMMRNDPGCRNISTGWPRRRRVKGSIDGTAGTAGTEEIEPPSRASKQQCIVVPMMRGNIGGHCKSRESGGWTKQPELVYAQYNFIGSGNSLSTSSHGEYRTVPLAGFGGLEQCSVGGWESEKGLVEEKQTSSVPLQWRLFSS